jgi:hypothetical protein
MYFFPVQLTPLLVAELILEDVSIPIESSILKLIPEGGAMLRPKRFGGHYADLTVATDSTGVYRAFVTSSGVAADNSVEDFDSDGLSTKPFLFQTAEERARSEEYFKLMPWQHTQNEIARKPRNKPASTLQPRSTVDPEEALLAFQRSTQIQMDAMNRSFKEQLKQIASLVQPKENEKESKTGIKQGKNEYDSLGNPPPPPTTTHSGKYSPKRRETKLKFNGVVKNYKDGAKRQRNSRKIEKELEGATAVDGPDVLLKFESPTICRMLSSLLM